MYKLYPLKFHPIFKDKIWGGQKIRTILGQDFSPLKNCGEAWVLSGYPGNQSLVKNGFLAGNQLDELIEVYMGDLVGDQVFEDFNTRFPILIKFLDANDYLSIQVHPDDELAWKRHQLSGKNEMWYIIQADEEAELISGFNKKITREEYLHHLEHKSLKSILNVEKVSSGDVFHIPAGRVHALGPGILLAEIQQCSDLTYRIYDWDRLGDDGKPREIHTELALEAIDFEQYDHYKTLYSQKLNQTVKLINTAYFSTNLLHFEQPIEKDYSEVDSFIIYLCLSGNAEVFYSPRLSEKIQTGECMLIPAQYRNLLIYPHKEAKILEIYIAS